MKSQEIGYLNISIDSNYKSKMSWNGNDAHIFDDHLAIIDLMNEHMTPERRRQEEYDTVMAICKRQSDSRSYALDYVCMKKEDRDKLSLAKQGDEDLEE